MRCKNLVRVLPVLVLASIHAPAVHADDWSCEGIPLTACAPDPDVMVGVGVNLRHFAAPSRDVAARSTAPTPSPTDSAPNALTATERLGFQLLHPLYGALEVELGNFTYTGTESSRSARDILLVGAGAIGLRGNLAFAALGVELAGGGLAYSHPDDRGLRGAPLLEVRGRADIWLTPWFTVGATLGTSLIRDDEWLAGVSLATHTAPFGGI
ncbi:MAG TPA: hypothetical protein VFS15_03350 [Kofleriaceae bacterium]|nr:hypothetical protein [Kofleriaceae bacterium]